MGDHSRARRNARDKRIKDKMLSATTERESAFYKPTISGYASSEDLSAYSAMYPDVIPQNLPNHVFDAFMSYTSSAYQVINENLDRLKSRGLLEQAAEEFRGVVNADFLLDTPDTPLISETIRSTSISLYHTKTGVEVSDYLNQHTAPKNFIVRREETNRSPVYKALQSGDVTVGTVISRGGLTSATITDYSLTGNNKRIEYKIKVPKGTKGAYIAAVSSMPSESEFLFPSNARFKITKITKSSFTNWDGTSQDNYEVEMEALP